MFPLKLAFRPWKLQPLAQVLTFTSLGMLLFLVGVFGWLSLSLPGVRAELEGDRVASVFIDPATEATHLESIRDQIRVSLGSSTARVDYISSEKFLESLGEKQPELAKEIAALGGNEKEWITPKHFAIRGTITSKEIDRMKSIPGVESVSYSEKRFRPIVENLAAMEWLCRLLAAATIFATLTTLVLLGRINAGIFAEAEIIVAQLGGNDWQARFPTRLNPVLTSVGASIIAAILFRAFQPGIAQKISTLSPFLNGIESASAVSSLAIFGVGIAVGVLATAFSPSASKAEARA